MSMALRRTKTYDFKSFIKREEPAPVSKYGAATVSVLPLGLVPMLTPHAAHAQEVVEVNATVHDKMMTAFQPIIELVQALAYPVALLVVLAGGLFVMIGNSDKGLSLVSRAGLGYCLVIMLPMLLDVLVDAMKSVV